MASKSRSRQQALHPLGVSALGVQQCSAFDSMVVGWFAGVLPGGLEDWNLGEGRLQGCARDALGSGEVVFWGVCNLGGAGVCGFCG